MKKINSLLLPLMALSLFIWGCEKDENKVYYEGGTAPELAANTATVTLKPGEEGKQAISFRWTNPNYKFTTGISSQDVIYRLEMDKAGANFTSAKKYSSSISRDLVKQFTVGELNNILGNDMQLQTGVEHTIEARVTASLAGDAFALPSNTITFKATPFAPPPKVALPSSGELYLVGNATPGGWDNPVPVPSQKFTKVSDTKYEITIALTGGNSYLMLPVNGSWADKYGWAGNNNENKPDGDLLRRGGGDIKAPAANGTYKISVNFQIGEFTVVKQ